MPQLCLVRWLATLMSAVRWRFVFWLAGMCTTTSILKHQLDHLRIGGGTASIVLSIFLSPTTLGIPIIIISKAQGFAYFAIAEEA